MKFIRNGIQQIFLAALLAVGVPISGWAQSVSLSLGSGSALPGATVNLTLSVTSAGSQPGSVEWSMVYPAADISAVNVTAGSAATAAGKSVSCSSGTGTTVCVLYGMNENAVANGALANVALTITAGTLDSSAPVQVMVADAVNPGGTSLPATGSSGVITIGQTAPSLKTLSCSPSSVTGPGSTTCTAALTSAALTGGSVVTVSSNNTYVTVPASFTIAAGATTGTFTASVASVSSAQNATLTATSGGASQSFSLSVIAGQTWTISGSITPAASGSGATVTLSGAASKSATADANGNFSFTGLANGSYTVTPTKSGYTISPSNLAVTINGANPAALSFTATSSQGNTAPSIDVTVSGDMASPGWWAGSPTFSMKSANELLLAFVTTTNSGATVQNVSGAGVSWVLVQRTNTQAGSAEIWRAFATQRLSYQTVGATLSHSASASITVMSFSGVDPSGTNGSGAIGAIGKGTASSGVPSAKIVTTRNNSLVAGAGDDPKAAIARTPVTGQHIVHQRVANRSTLWIQAMNSPVPASGTTVTIADSAPAFDAYNLSVVEVLAAPAGSGSSITSLTPAIGTESSSDAVTMADTATGQSGDVCTAGGLASLTGENFTSQQPQSATSFPLPTTLAGVQVLVNGQPAYLLFASAAKLTFQCPSLKPGTALEVVVNTDSGATLPALHSVLAPASPGIFTLNGQTQGIIQTTGTNLMAMAHSDSLASRPVHAGESVTIFATGLGELERQVADGNAAPADLQMRAIHQIRVKLGGETLEPSFAGLMPGTTGIFRIEVQIPQDIIAGDAIPLSLEVILPDSTTVQSNTVTFSTDGSPEAVN